MSTLFNPRSPFAFLLAFIYAILATIGLFNPYKDFPTPDYPEGSINHHYSKYEGGYDNWYGRTSIQGILNMINAKDKDGIASKFSLKTKNNKDIGRQIDILFDYIEGEIIEFETTYNCTSHTNAEYGLYHDYTIHAPSEIKTTKYSYDFVMLITILNDDESNIGIADIYVTRKDVNDFHRLWNIPYSFPDSYSGITCYGFDGIIV